MQSNKEELFTSAKLYNRKGDLTKRWYIEFAAIDETTGQLRKKQIYCPAKFTTAKQREIWGRETCKQINKLLEKGAKIGTSKEDNNKEEETRPSIASLLKKGIDKSLRKKTKETYNTAINKFISFLGTAAEKEVSIITPVLVNNFQKHLIESGLQNTTVNNILLKTKTVFSHLHKSGLISVQPFVYRKLTESESSQHEYFTDHDRVLIQDHLKEHHPELYLFTRFIYFTFVRPAEIKKLTFANIDLIRGTLTVPGKISKNRKTQTIPIHPDLLQLLPTDQPKHFYIFGKGLKPSPYELATNYAYNKHKVILESLGYNRHNYTLYSWKHTGAVNAYMAGIDLKTLQFLLRHTTVQHTEIYLRKLRVLVQDIQLRSW